MKAVAKILGIAAFAYVAGFFLWIALIDNCLTEADLRGQSHEVCRGDSLSGVYMPVVSTLFSR